jgi:flagellar M-ring protein FliF
MGARIQTVLGQVWEFLRAQPPARQVMIVSVFTTSTLGVLLFAWWMARPNFVPLFSNLSPSDASAIVEALKGDKVPYELDDGGRTVLVPSEKLYEQRIALASRGLPEGGSVGFGGGFEIFDKQALGQTDFLQHLNYQRALQGELARTIGGLGGVESARVHLAMPERSLFASSDRRPSASVVVKLAAGRTLSPAQIDGIVHLVAASVQDLDADSVTVVDESGRILTPDRRGGDTAGISSAALEYQHAVERQIADRVETMLGAVVGPGKALARVAATLDFSRVERTEETYDPDRTALKQSRTTREESTGARPANGAPGVQANLTNDAAAAPTEGGEGPKSQRKDETQSFEVSKVVERTVGATGAVKQLSVAVLIDGTYTEEGGEKKFTPRPQEEIDRLKELVKSAVGFSEKRGDKIEIASVQFQTAELPPGEGVVGGVLRTAQPYVMRVLAFGVFVFAMLWIVRPMVASLGTATARRTLPGRVTGPEAALAITQENVALAQQNPERAAQLVREWLSEHPGEPTG